MISTESLKIEWIEAVAKAYGYPDKQLIEKAIRALYLLESLVVEGCPLIFKGGSCLLLLLRDSLHRLSIDVDIICPPGTDVEMYLEKMYSHGFTRVSQLHPSMPRNNIPVSHSKIYYEVSYRTGISEGYIKLDVLYEEVPYVCLIQEPISHKILLEEGAPTKVWIPSLGDMMGDKLTAFGPHSIGIPYDKGSRDCSLEIIKQLFDIGRLFEHVDDFEAAYRCFERVSQTELEYRGMSGRLDCYFDDVRATAMCICTRGRTGAGDFTRLQKGIIRLKPFMYQRSYQIEDAIVDAARAAYLATCYERHVFAVEKFRAEQPLLCDIVIRGSLPGALNRLRSGSPEAFFYWTKISEMLS